MSHLPWPTLPTSYAPLYNGEPTPRDGALDEARTLVEAHPAGIPLPEDFSGEGEFAPRAYFCWTLSGEVLLQLSRTTRRGEPGTSDEGGEWGESLSVQLSGTGPEAEPLDARLSAAARSPYQSAQTVAEQRASEAFHRRQALIRAWANSREAATIPWGSMLDSYRRDIVDCVGAIQQVVHHDSPGAADPRVSKWIDTVAAAVDTYPVAKRGLLVLLCDVGVLGLLDEMGRLKDDGEPQRIAALTVDTWGCAAGRALGWISIPEIQHPLVRITDAGDETGDVLVQRLRLV